MSKSDVYIYLKQEDWLANRSSNLVTVQDVQTAYTNHKRKYKEGAQILKYKKVYKEMVRSLSDSAENSKKLTTEALQNAYKEVMDMHINRGITQMRFDIARGMTNLTVMSSGKTEKAVNTIYNHIKSSKIDEILKFLHEIDAKFEVYMNNARKLATIPGVMSPDDVGKLAEFRDALARMMKKTTDPSKRLTKKDLAEEIRVIGSLAKTAFSGGEKEFWEQVGGVLRQNAASRFKKAANSVSGKSGLRVTSTKMDQTGLGNTTTTGQSGQAQVSKADNAFLINVRSTISNQKGSIFIGISEKANKPATFPWGNNKMTGSGFGALVKDTGYNEVFNRVHNKKIENFFVNEYVHTDGAVLNDSSSLVMKYITAKVASYALSGGDLQHLAYFFHAGDEIIYIPAVLGEMGKRASDKADSYLRLSARVNGEIAPNTYEETPEERSNKVYSSIKRSLKFSVGIASNDFYSLLKGTKYDV